IDLSADFRLKLETTYSEWYGEKHQAPHLLKKTVYGLPEFHRKEIQKASLIANPGCYPTSAVLALAPLLREGGIDLDSIVVDSKSGVSGAGRSVSEDKQFIEAHEGVKAYKVASHRHTPEIEQELSFLAETPLKISFTPHLIPMSRGILTTAYVHFSNSISLEKVHKLYQKFYPSEPFVRVCPAGQFPNTSHVRGTNFCDIGVAVDPRVNRIIVVSAIDNLVKGASGQAIQNMNIRFGWDETTGLLTPGFVP
ncbi:MAG: N-acetyl-gamma-glutamyl-phosphate reductase, partial [Deltaproteobacteria bacterium]|nr:N-acetyl-gamma-glutamyl-phosphate reductase [Deltaproteobacteria bacterium]